MLDFSEILSKFMGGAYERILDVSENLAKFMGDPMKECSISLKSLNPFYWVAN